MLERKFVNGLALVAVLVIILGVGSAARSAFAAPIELDLKTGGSTSQSR